MAAYVCLQVVLVLALLVHTPVLAAIWDEANYNESVKFYLMTSEWPAGIEVNVSDPDALIGHGFNKSIRTTVIIHGYGHDITDDLFNNVAGALLQTGAETNIFGVDWGALCPKPMYVTARSRVAGVGQRVGDVLSALQDSGLVRLPEVHIIGHSLGAHVSGNVGKAARVGRITGLDPAGPLFFQFSGDRLSSTDADLVDVVHTCIGLLGYEQPLGDVDFYPNGGRLSQPGCTVLTDRLDPGHCSHMRSYELFGESILDSKAFPASYCGSKAKKAMDGKCPSTDINGRMGYHVQYAASGVYYLRTRDKTPFSF